MIPPAGTSVAPAPPTAVDQERGGSLGSGLRGSIRLLCGVVRAVPAVMAASGGGLLASLA
jgi:hypothetical protein